MEKAIPPEAQRAIAEFQTNEAKKRLEREKDSKRKRYEKLKKSALNKKMWRPSEVLSFIRKLGLEVEHGKSHHRILKANGAFITILAFSATGQENYNTSLIQRVIKILLLAAEEQLSAN